MKLFVFLLHFAFLINMSKEDLPVHCLKSQIVGKWRIKASLLKKVDSGHKMDCGYKEPSSEEGSWRAQPKNMSLDSEYIVELQSNDTALLRFENTTIIGKWTMVYDEGFDILFPNFSFFAFSNYTIERNSTNREIIYYKSHCYRTLVGWYHNNQNNWGCYKARKILETEDVNLVSYVKEKNLTEENVTYVDPQSSNDTEIKQTNMRFKSQSKAKRIDFREISRIHEEYLEKLKSVNKNWQATLYPEFRNMTLKDLNNFAGIVREDTEEENYETFRMLQLLKIKKGKNHMKKHRKLKLNPNRNNNSPDSNCSNITFNSNNTNSTKMKQSNDIPIEKSKIQLPVNFDWKKVLQKTRSQGSCGSCYAWSAMRMLEARIKLKYNEDVQLSVQHSLDCSFYNQGCKGGYAYLVLKFSKEFELIPEQCKPYTSKSEFCAKPTCNKSVLDDFKYKVNDYYYLGGSYGKSDEELMMNELHTNGPFVVSIEPDYGFMFYKSGIYSSVEVKNWRQQSMVRPEWLKVDHSVLLVGWGVDEKTSEKYWLIQNSWGANWGEDGFFKIKRGNDELAVESIAEIGVPGIKTNINNENKK